MNKICEVCEGEALKLSTNTITNEKFAFCTECDAFYTLDFTYLEDIDTYLKKGYKIEDLIISDYIEVAE